MGVAVDSSDAKRLAVALETAAKVAPEETRKVIARGALNVKRDAQRRISGHPHLPHYPASITYDTELTPTGASAQVGPDKRRPQGPLGNILEYGSPSRPPIPHLGPALQAEEPRLVKALEDLAARLVDR